MDDNLIRIAYLYEDLMNTYGDSGDVKILRYFLQKKGWQTQIDNISLGSRFNEVGGQAVLGRQPS